MNSLASYITLFAVLLIMLSGLLKKRSIFDDFTKGAKEGLLTTFSIAPTVVALLTSIAMFKSSGAMDLFIQLLSPLTNVFNIPKELIPIMLIKPLSGSSSLALLDSIFKDFGPDSFIGKAASVIMGSTETTFYILTVYLASSKLKVSKKVLFAAIIANVFSFLFGTFLLKII